MKRRLIIIPAYNEAENIAAVIETIRKTSESDILVIDDHSKDQTAAIARASGAHVVRHPFNMGYGAALQTGYKFATQKGYDLLVQIDGDAQHDPRHIPELFEQVESCECDLVIGSRFLSGEKYRAGFLKSAGIWLFRKVVWGITGQQISDPTSGYQCLNKEVFSLFTQDRFPADYPDANIIVMLHRMGYVVREIPVRMVPNTKRAGMHRGFFKISYYMFKVFLTIFVTLLKKKTVSSTS